jgi:hypothetical protein
MKEVWTYNTSSMLLAASLLGSLDNFRGDYAAVRCRDAAFFHFTRHAFLDQMAQAKTYFGDFGGGNGGCHLLMVVMWEHYVVTTSQKQDPEPNIYGGDQTRGQSNLQARSSS